MLANNVGKENVVLAVVVAASAWGFSMILAVIGMV